MTRSTRLRTLVIAAALAMTSSLAVSSPANAAYPETKTQRFSQGFVDSGSLTYIDPSYCLRWKAQGVVSFTAKYEKYWGEAVNQWLYRYNIEKVNLGTIKITVDTFKRSGSSCTTERKNFKRITINTHARGYSCDFNPSISLGAPWAAAVSFWPSCGDKSLVDSRGTNTSASHYQFARTDPEDWVYFKSSQGQGVKTAPATNLTWKCYGMNFEAALLSPANAEDNKHSPRVKACPTWNGSLAAF